MPRIAVACSIAAACFFGSGQVSGDPATFGPIAYHNAKVAASKTANADGTGGTPANGVAVRGWRDLSGNGNHVSSSAAGTSALNAADALLFNGTTSVYTAATLTGGARAQPCTMLVVGRQTQAGCFASYGNLMQFSRSTQAYIAVSNAGANLVAGACPDMGTQRRAYIIEFNGNSTEISVGGRKLVRGAGGATTADRIRYGQSPTGGATYLNGELCMVALIPGLLSQAQKDAWVAWARAEFGCPDEMLNTTYTLVPTATGRVNYYGDSITKGIGGLGAQGVQPAGTLEGFRVRLFELAFAAGKTYLPVGTQFDGPATVSGQPFPREHSGIGGQTTTVQFARVATEMSTTTPELVIAFAPSVNDCIANRDLAIPIDPYLRLGNLLDGFRAGAPSAQVIVTNLLPTTSPGLATFVAQYNALCQEVIQLRANAGMKIVFRDANAFFTANGGTCPDGVHPDDTSYRNAIAPLLWADLQNVLP